ncbi:MAG: TOMM precursor leader peptide-binding protein [Deltaproteobacteria bacterium]|nr:TOMM precursor leader peptide-binding protein [Deltaproteobacteria bacterium]
MRPKLPEKPRLKSTFAVRTDKDVLFLLAEDKLIYFKGQSFVEVAPYLDGARSIPELLALVGKKIPLGEFFSVLGQFAAQGCFADGPPASEFPELWDELGNPNRAGPIGPVAIEALGVSSELLAGSLSSLGVSTSAAAPFLVAAVDDYLAPGLRELNRRRHQARAPWMIVKPTGPSLWVGPVIWPDETGCWACLEDRLSKNRDLARYADKYGQPVFQALRPVESGAATPFDTAGASLAALEIVKTLSSKEKGIGGKIFVLDLLSHEYSEHVVVKRPQCSVCGSIDALEAKPIEIQSRPKMFAAMSGHRSALSEETFARFSHHISPISGIVTNLGARDVHNSELVHNYTAGHYFPLFSDDFEQVQINRYARSGGCGRSADAAKMGALAEAIERYSGIWTGVEKTIVSSFLDLGSDAIHPRDILLYSRAQYERRAITNPAAISNQQVVPDPVPDDLPISWTPAWSMTHHRFVHLPTSHCFYGFREQVLKSISDSNGDAAGNSLEEAILQGFYELVERDAVALWWHNRVRRPLVDADSFGNTVWDETKRHYRDVLDRELHVLDVTTDLGVAAFVVVSHRRNPKYPDITLGFAAHFDPETALLRALGNANQYLPGVSLLNADGSTRYRYLDKEALAWFRSASYDSQPYLLPDARVAPRSATDFANQAAPDIAVDLSKAIAIVRGLGLEMIVVDHTRPDIGMPVVKVVIPGLRHFWRRLGPGRLYETPVKLGWLEAPRAEVDMNPVACFV